MREWLWDSSHSRTHLAVAAPPGPGAPHTPRVEPTRARPAYPVPPGSQQPPQHLRMGFADIPRRRRGRRGLLSPPAKELFRAAAGWVAWRDRPASRPSWPPGGPPGGNGHARSGHDRPGGRQRPPRPLLRTTLGHILRRARREQGRTLADVAEAARVSMPYLSELERGRKEASSEVLAAVCDALRIELSDLLAQAGRNLADERARRALNEERARRIKERTGVLPADFPVPAGELPAEVPGSTPAPRRSQRTCQRDPGVPAARRPRGCPAGRRAPSRYPPGGTPRRRRPGQPGRVIRTRGILTR